MESYFSPEKKQLVCIYLLKRLLSCFDEVIVDCITFAVVLCHIRSVCFLRKGKHEVPPEVIGKQLKKLCLFKQQCYLN